MKTIEEVAQWVIDNRFSINELKKVSDLEMYHTLVDFMNQKNSSVIISSEHYEEDKRQNDEFRNKVRF